MIQAKHWRALLIPIGAALVTSGLEWITEQASLRADELERMEQRRRELYGELRARESALSGGPRVFADASSNYAAVAAADTEDAAVPEQPVDEQPSRPSWRRTLAVAAGLVTGAVLVHVMASTRPGRKPLADRIAEWVAGMIPDDMADELLSGMPEVDRDPPAPRVDEQLVDEHHQAAPMCPWPNCPGYDPPEDLPDADQRLAVTMHINSCIYRPAGAAVR